MEVLKCPLCCDSFFNTRDTLIQHLSKYNNSIPCSICGHTCPDIKTLINHISSCSSNKVIQCHPSEYEENDCDVDIAAEQISDPKAELKETRRKKDTSEVPEDYLHGISENHNYSQWELFSENGESFVIVDKTGMEYDIRESNDDTEINQESAASEADSGGDDILKTEHNQQLSTEEMLSFKLEANNQEREHLKLFNENGDSEYVLIQPPSKKKYSISHVKMSDESRNVDENNEALLITMELDEMENEVENKKDEQLSDIHEELFSCTTCGVSFTSISKHLEDFHTNQHFVVELNGETVTNETALEKFTSDTPSTSQNVDAGDDPGDDLDTDESMEPSTLKENIDDTDYKADSVDKDDSTSDNVDEPGDTKSPELVKRTKRVKRVITETGQIETMLVPNIVDKKASTCSPNILKKSTVEKVLDSKGRVYTRKVVQVGKFWKEKPPPKKKPETKKANKIILHQAVQKFMSGPDGAEKIKIFHCIACGVCVKSLNELKDKPCKHLKYKCKFCPVSYESAKSLCAHMKVHKAHKKVKAEKKDNGNHHFCDICCTLFSSNKSLRLHVRMHEPVKMRQAVPPHLINADDKMNYYECNQCNESIPISYKNVHDIYHQTSTQFVCVICNRMFLNEENLIMHMNIHNIEKEAKPIPEKSLPYTCIYCYKQFSRPHEKVKHERIHTGEKPHKCAVCGKAFRIAYCLTLHMRTHSGDRPYHCKHCGKRFKAHSVYNHHIQTHSDVRAYKCPYCPKAFKTSVLLNGHKNSHTKPFACTVCNRRFSSLYAVRMHMEYHQKDNKLKYSCTICGAIYARQFSLRDHIKLEHEDVASDVLESLKKDKELEKTDVFDEMVYPEVATSISKGKTMPVLEQ